MSKFFDILLLSRDAAFHAISYAYPIRLEDIRKKYASVYDGYVPCLELKISSNDVTEKIKKAEIDFCDIALCNSDDDRLYWWNEDAGFELSEECRNWMEAIRAESQSICNRMGDIPSYPEQLNRLLDTLMSINDTYHTLFMFKDSFYDILEIHSRESAAAVELLQRLAHRNATKFQEEISKMDTFWSRFNQAEARREVKRYLALLGNRVLRKNVLSF